MMTKTMILMAAILGGGDEPTQPASPAPVASIAGALDDIASLSLGQPTPAKTLSAGEVVDKVQKFYKGTKTLSAKFRQTYTNATFGKKSISDGKVWIDKPGKMRWDYKGKKLRVEKSFISDGQTLWAVEHDTKQIFTKSLKDNLLPVAITFLYGRGDLKADFKPAIVKNTKYGKKSDIVLELTPRKPSAQYKTLYLVVDPGNFRVKQSVVVEPSRNTNHFMFFEPKFNIKTKRSWFQFNVNRHKDYRLIKK